MALRSSEGGEDAARFLAAIAAMLAVLLVLLRCWQALMAEKRITVVMREAVGRWT